MISEHQEKDSGAWAVLMRELEGSLRARPFYRSDSQPLLPASAQECAALHDRNDVAAYCRASRPL